LNPVVDFAATAAQPMTSENEPKVVAANALQGDVRLVGELSGQNHLYRDDRFSDVCRAL
jgi:hypothetical protein